MFKSIFSKYLTTFTVILVCCIVVILVAVSSRISTESYAIQRDAMDASAGSAALVIESHLGEKGYNNLYTAFKPKSKLQSLLDNFAQSAHAEIYVFDNNGSLVTTTDAHSKSKSLLLTESVRSSMQSNNNAFLISTVDGLFEETQFNSYRVATVDNKPVYVLISVRNYTNVVFGDILMVTITVSLWVFLAAMISLYIISRYINVIWS